MGIAGVTCILGEGLRDISMEGLSGKGGEGERVSDWMSGIGWVGLGLGGREGFIGVWVGIGDRVVWWEGG